MEKKTTTKKAPVKKTTAKTTSKKPATAAKKSPAKKPAVKEKTQTVVLTIQATYILKGDQQINPDFTSAPDKFPMNTIDMNVCPGASDVQIKKLQVFETEEKKGGK